MEPKLKRQLERVDERLFSVRREQASAIAWVVFAALGLALIATGAWAGWAGVKSAWILIVVAPLAVILLRVILSRHTSDPLRVARLIEEHDGQLDSSLLAAAELEPDLPDGRYGFLARRLIDEVLSQARLRPWTAAVPESRVRRAHGLHYLAAAGFAVAALLLLNPTRAGLTGSLAHDLPSAPTYAVTVLPGDADIELGRSVLVSAEFAGTLVPDNAELVTLVDGVETQRLPMSMSLDDPVFGVRLAAVLQDIEYRVEWSGQTSPTYRLGVFEHPELKRSDVLLDYPAYTGLEDRRIEDTRRVTVPEGTRLTLICQLNKAVASAILDEHGTQEETGLVQAAASPLEYRAEFVLTESLRLALTLVDAEGRTNRLRTEFVFRVTQNSRPDLRLTSGGDVRVSPLEELALNAALSDDFGLTSYGLSYRIGGQESVDVVLGSGSEDARPLEASHTIALEELNARPAQLVSYHFWADDLDVEGELRRTRSDLFFAEVRPFEEIFREAEQPPGGQSQGGPQEGGPQGEQEAQEELVDLQREILLATWGVLRREADGEGELVPETQVVRDAQQEAKDRLSELSGAESMLGGSDLTLTAEELGQEMDRALLELDRALQTASAGPLHDALAGEQGAYEKLLELRASETAVTRGNQPPGSPGQGGGGGSASQAQLSELQLDSEENRYETQRQATPSLNEGAARETRQALSRLKELAQRQRDVNERLRELQSELLAVETEEEREELRRRLKRLQEAEEEILRDTDELRQRMDESEDPRRLTEQREQLDQTRENMRRASEALEEGRVAEALAEGTRASNELDELEQELRDAAGSQFGERMQQMQREARQLEEEQERLAGELGRPGEESSRSLRESDDSDPGDREELQRDLELQQEALDELLSEVEETVRDAELPEPLLAEELFDTLNEARGQGVSEALDMTREMLERGFPEQAQQAERLAGAGVTQLREGIENAAESVLGTGVEALERAEAELERLSSELDSELAEARGESEQGQPGDPSQPGQPGQPSEGEPGEGEPGDPGQGEQGEGQPGEGQPGEGQPGEGQPGQGQPGQGQPRPGGPPDLRTSDPRQPEVGGGRGRGGEALGPVAPLTGEDFMDWSDRLRDVEEMIDDPELSAEAARLRGRARTVREDLKRHGQDPNWDLVDEKIARPLAELHRLVAEEVRRRKADDALVPIDRDPVPPEFAEDVQRYYERLGRDK